MQPNKIESTSDYSKFVFKIGNRPVSSRTAKLMAAMKNHNQLQEYPILVSGINGHLEIADGQHRFSAAKALGYPIFYIRSRQPVDIAQIAAANALQKTWSLNDWLCSWVARDAREYAVLKRFCETFQVPVTVGMEIIGSNYSGLNMEDFKHGKFKVVDLKFGQIVGHVIGALRGHVPVADLRLVRALIRILRVPKVNIDRLIKKLCKHSTMFQRQANWAKYVEVIEQLYNTHVSVNQRVSIVFEVDKLERSRKRDHMRKNQIKGAEAKKQNRTNMNETPQPKPEPQPPPPPTNGDND